MSTAVIEWMATIAVAFGALMVAHQGAMLRPGFVLCLVSNVLWAWFATRTDAPGLQVTQFVFACINLYGLFRTAHRARPGPAGALEMSELCPWRVP